MWTNILKEMNISVQFVYDICVNINARCHTVSDLHKVQNCLDLIPLCRFELIEIAKFLEYASVYILNY